MIEEKIAYCVYNQERRVLVFYYGEIRPDAFPLEDFVDIFGDAIGNECECVFFDSSFKDFVPESCSGWFSNFKVLKQVFGLENLNVSNVSDYSRMFSGCMNIIALDLSRLCPKSSIKVDDMFEGCINLGCIKGVKEFLDASANIPPTCEKSRYIGKREAIQRSIAASS